MTEIDTSPVVSRDAAPKSSADSAWYDDLLARGGDVWNAAKENPTTAILGGMAVGVAAIGALRTAFPRLAATALESELPYFVHLTSKEGLTGVSSTSRLGGQWGIFGLPHNRVPSSEVGRLIKTLVPRDTSHAVMITGEGLAAFRPPAAVGPFSLARRMAGVHSTPLGSFDLAAGKFVEGEVFKDGVFTAATKSDRLKFGLHQFILDYGVDTELYAVGALLANRQR